MAFFKFRRSGPQGNEGRSSSSVGAAPAESVEAMRRRARHRLLGAAVLVLLGVIGFPLLFDTQPRPISVDIPIEIPDRSKAKPLALPTAPPATTTSMAGKPDAKAQGNADSRADNRSDPAPDSAPAGDGMITEAADGSEIPSGKVAAAAAAGAAGAAAVAAARPDPGADAKTAAKADSKPKPDAKPDSKTATKPADTKVASAKPSVADDGGRARALLDGKPLPAAAAAPASASPAADDNGHFVVQVGAFADADKAREVRQKLEKAGLKTYTNVAKTGDGDRTRVRVGPFATRAEADRAAGKVKGLSLPAAVLSL